MNQISTPGPAEARESEARESVRSNLMLAAIVRSRGASHAGKIRDLSPAGAQIESPLQPEVGRVMTLVRGELSVEGHVSWSAAGRFGLFFAAPVSVSEWMAKPRNRHQQRVDALVAIVRADSPPLVMAADDGAWTAYGLAEDLQRLARLLEGLGDRLASDPAVATHHGSDLQSLDIALQTLCALAGAIEPDSARGDASRARLDALRISCDEALAGAGRTS